MSSLPCAIPRRKMRIEVAKAGCFLVIRNASCALVDWLAKRASAAPVENDVTRREALPVFWTRQRVTAPRGNSPTSGAARPTVLAASIRGSHASLSLSQRAVVQERR